MGFIKDKSSDTVTIPIGLYSDLLRLVGNCAFHTDDAIRTCDRMTSGNVMHDKAYVKQILEAKKSLSLRCINEYNLEEDIKSSELPYIKIR